MGRYLGLENEAHLSDEDGMLAFEYNELNQFGNPSVYAKITTPDYSGKGFNEPIESKFYVRGYELIRMMEWLIAHPMFNKCVEEYNNHYKHGTRLIGLDVVYETEFQYGDNSYGSHNVDFVFDWNPDEGRAGFDLLKVYKDFECPKLACGGPPPTYVEDVCEDHIDNICPEDLTDDDDQPLTKGCYRWRGTITFSETHTVDGHEFSEEWIPESVKRVGEHQGELNENTN